MPENSLFVDASSTHTCEVCGQQRYLVQLSLRGEPPRQVCTRCCTTLLHQPGAAPSQASTEPPTGLAILQELGRLLVVWGVTDWEILNLYPRRGEGKNPACCLQLRYEQAIALLAKVEPPDSTTCWPPFSNRKPKSWTWKWIGRVLGADLELMAVQSEPAPDASALSCASSSGLSQPPPDGAARDFAEDTICVDEEGARP